MLRDGTGIRLSHTSASPASVRWYRFSRLGGAYAEELTHLSPESVNAVLHKGASMLVAELSDGRVAVSALVTYENEPSSKLKVEYDSSSSLESVRRLPLIV